MADKNWQAGGKNSIPALALVCLSRAWPLPFGSAAAAPVIRRLCARPAISATLDPEHDLGNADRRHRRRVLSRGGRAVGACRRCAGAKRAKLRRSAFVSSALNNLNQGVVMTDAQRRDGVLQRSLSRNLRACRVGYLERHDRAANCWRCGARAACSISASRNSASAAAPKASSPNCPTGDRCLSKMFRLPNGGTVGDA